MKTFFRRTAFVSLILGLSANTYAHRAWVLPSATVLSSDDAWVTLDASISNDLFHSDYHPMGLAGLEVLSPTGEPVPMHNQHKGKYRSSFDLNLIERGTYKVFTASAGLRAHWQSDNGERQRWPGRGEAYTEEGFANNVPANATNLQVIQFSRRIETFVTAGAPSEHVLHATGTGLELVPVTHPNDLFSGEVAEFQFVIDGEPAAGAAVTVIPGGMRYRDSQDAIELEADDKGIVQLTWPHAGMYWLNANYSDDKATQPATQRSGAYTAVFEVLPL